MIKLIFLLLSISYGYSARRLMVQSIQNAKAKDHTLGGSDQLLYTCNRGDIYTLNWINKTPFSFNRADLKKQEICILFCLRDGLKG